MADERATRAMGARTDAASMIAELWAERENGAPSSPSPTSRPSPRHAAAPRAPRAPRPRAAASERGLATAIVALILGGALGVVAVSLGYIGAPSKTEFVAKADAICTSTNRELAGIPKPTGYPTLIAASSTVLRTTDGQLARLRSLELPGGAERARAKIVLAAMKDANATTRDLRTAAGASDDARVVVDAQLLRTYSKDATAKATAYGLHDCASGMQPGIDSVLGGAGAAVKDSFLSKAGSTCLTAMDAVLGMTKPKTATELTHYASESTAAFAKLATALKALPVPPGDEATVAEMFAAMDRANAKMKEFMTAAVSGDLKRMTALQKEFDALDVAAGAKLEGYGLNVCGYNT